jgi:hypothetical protein
MFTPFLSSKSNSAFPAVAVYEAYSGPFRYAFAGFSFAEHAAQPFRIGSAQRLSVFVKLRSQPWAGEV